MAWGLTRSNHTGVDCDHIAAIDNVARKLSAARRPAALVGLWFSLGHSTVVVLLCAAVSTGSAYARAHVASCVEIKLLRRVRAESSRRHARHRRDACSLAWRCRFLAARPSQDGTRHTG